MSDRDLVAEDAASFTEITDDRQRRFLAAYARLGRIGTACRAAGVTPKTTWNWREQDPTFAAAFLVAQRLAVDNWESELARRAFEGVETPKFYKGRLIATLREYDTQAGIFMLRGARPEKYRETAAPPPTASTTIVDVHLSTLTDAQLEARVRQLTDLLRPAVLPATIEAAAVASEVVDPHEAAYAKALTDRANGRSAQ